MNQAPKRSSHLPPFRAGPRPAAARLSFLHVLSFLLVLPLVLVLAACLAACRGQAAAPRPLAATAAPGAASGAASDARPAGSAAEDAAGAEEGSGPQILTADLVQRQEVHAGKLTVRWSIIGSNPILSVTVNGEPQRFTPADTLQIAKELTLTVAQTLVTVEATDAQGEKRTRAYLIVNPDLPIEEPERGFAVPALLPVTEEERKAQEADLAAQDERDKAKFKEAEFTPWVEAEPFGRQTEREVRAGRYPVWIEARQSAGAAPQFRAVFRPLPAGVLTHRAHWGLTPRAYNRLVYAMISWGYRQQFREVYRAPGGEWIVQTVWVLRAGGQ
jgi:hypothetical protein